jgi:hypothetical protein
VPCGTAPDGPAAGEYGAAGLAGSGGGAAAGWPPHDGAAAGG